MKDNDFNVRFAGVKRGNLTPEQHERALTDKNWIIRQYAVRLGNLTPEQFERALADPDTEVNGAVSPSAAGTHRSYLPHSGIEAVGIPCL